MGTGFERVRRTIEVLEGREHHGTSDLDGGNGLPSERLATGIHGSMIAREEFEETAELG